MLLARAFGPKSDIIARKIWIHGQNAGVSSPSQHRPHSTRTFSLSARSASFPTRRVFPMPASPLTTKSCPRPACASSSATRSCASSHSRPINTLPDASRLLSTSGAMTLMQAVSASNPRPSSRTHHLVSDSRASDSATTGEAYPTRADHMLMMPGALPFRPARSSTPSPGRRNGRCMLSGSSRCAGRPAAA